MHRTILTTAILFNTILVLLLISINITETRAIESHLDLGKKWSGDFDGMTERHLIRALVPYSKTFYFLDGADQRGLTYDLLKEFETYVNKELQRTSLKVRLVVIPTKRDRLLPALVEGLGDIAAGNLTITPVRQKQVDFSASQLTGVDEIIVTGPRAPTIANLDDLAGKEIHVRESSSYYESLMQLLPSTAADPNVNIREIDVMEHNVHAGVKFLRFLHDRRFGRETVQYVSNIYKYYIAYRSIIKNIELKKEKKFERIE